jgi:hypothetical protein
MKLDYLLFLIILKMSFGGSFKDKDLVLKTIPTLPREVETSR